MNSVCPVGFYIIQICTYHFLLFQFPFTGAKSLPVDSIFLGLTWGEWIGND